ncbi:MAG: efflux RND transporter permease subunit [Pseudomonadota bacterium]
MDFLTRFGLEKSRFTLLLMLGILAFGLTTYLSIPKRENPEITIRTAVVQFTFEGMRPERVENLIAIPAERKIREIGEVENIETTITNGSALLKASLFDTVAGQAITDAWEDLRNKMDDVMGELPEGTAGPFVNTDYGDVAIATVALTGDGFSLAELEDTADVLRTALFNEDGVSKVTFYGVQEERIWLEVDTAKLASIGVQIEGLLNDLTAQNVILPAGEIDADGTQIVLEANGDLASVDEIRGVLTQVEGAAGYVRLSDLVTVRRGYQDPAHQPVFFNGEPAIVLGVEMSPGTDIQDLGKRLKSRLAAFENAQPIGIDLAISTFQEENVTASVNNALSNVGQTFAVVLVVMLVFLGARAAVAIACIVPFTICFALSGMGLIGVDIEQVSIAAVIISLGLLVDNGLVVVEDLEGRIGRGEDPDTAARAAGAQFFTPLGVASITTISAFLPMLLLEGVEGEFAFSLGAVVTLMLLGSWLTALYILPFICVRLMKARPEGSDKPNPLIRLYGGLVRRILPFGAVVAGLAYGAVVLSGAQFGALKQEQFPFSERSDFLIYLDMPKETAISGTQAMAKRVQAWLADAEVNPGVVNSTAFVGSGGPRFHLGLNPADPDPASAFITVRMADLDAAIETADRARRVFLEQFPEANFRLTRLSQGGSESGVVDVEIFGPDDRVLMEAGRQVSAAIAELPAIVKNETDWGNRVIKVTVDIAQDKAREIGVTSQDISEVMDAYFSGTRYSTFREGDEQIPIIMRAREDARDSVEDLANLSVATNGRIISIDQVADFRPSIELSEIQRENQVRRLVVSGKSADLSAAEVLTALQPTLDGLDLGPAYKISIAGELEDSADVQGQLAASMPVALGVMIAALMFQFNSLRRTLTTLLTIPLIAIGAPYLMLALGQPMSFFATLGLMSLMGIIINNAIVLIDQIDIEREDKRLDEAVVTAAMKRARPVMLTSLTTIFGLIPMALAGGALFEPMATIMIGGLLISSPLTLLFVPCVYFLLFNWSAQEREPQRRAATEDLSASAQDAQPAPA